MPVQRKYAALIPFTLCILLFGYWLKGQLGINVFTSLSLSQYGPFKLLRRNEVISSNHYGILLKDNFDLLTIRHKWLGLYLPENGDITQDYDSNGYHNSRCLIIRSKSDKSWSCSMNKFVQVEPGDSLSYHAQVMIKGLNNKAFVGVDAFDESRKVKQWYFIVDAIDTTNIWTRIGTKFTTNGSMKYIRLRLSGEGMGEFRFDDLILQKVEKKTHTSKIWHTVYSLG